MLESLAVVSGDVPRYVGKVPFAVHGRGCLVSRNPLAVRPDKPLLRGPGGALFQRQLVPQRHWGILRRVSKLWRPSQRLLAGSTPCHESPPPFSIGDLPMSTYGQPIQ